MIARMRKGIQEAENMKFVQVQKEKQEYSSIFYLTNSHTPFFAIYFPVFNLNSKVYGQQIGMCVFIMKTDKLTEILQGEQATSHTQLYILDGENRILAVQGGGRVNPQYW